MNCALPLAGAQPRLAVPLKLENGSADPSTLHSRLDVNRENHADLLAGFLAGADFLPAAGAAVGLQDFFAEADGFGGDFHEFVVGDEFDGLLEA